MFRIGEFSRIAQVSGRLLRFYDEIGLFSPAYADLHSGYRYYSAQQLPQLNRILVLKELGLSLEQIARLLEQETSPEELRGMLTLRKAQIEQAVQEDLLRLRRIESRLQQLNVQGEVQEPDVVLKTVPSQPFWAIRDVLPDIQAVRQLVRSVATTVPTVVGQSSFGGIAVLVHAAVYEPDALDFEVGCFLTGKAPHTIKLSEVRVLTKQVLPAVETMATLVHIGRVEDSHQTYGLLASWLERHDFQMVGPGRELLVQLPDSTDTAVLELQLPVAKRDPDARV